MEIAVFDVGLQDDEIVHRAKNGDKEAFADLVKSHQQYLQRFISRKIPSREDAADLCQEVLLRAYLKLQTFEGRSTFRTWLLSIAKREIAQHYRLKINATTINKYQGRRRDLGCERLTVSEHRNDDILDMREQIDHCLACIAQNLSVEEEVAVILSDIYSMTDRESSKLVEKSVATFKHLLHEGRVTLNLISRDTCALVKKQGCPIQCRLVGGLPGATCFPCRRTLEARSDQPIGVLPSLRADLVRGIQAAIRST